MKFFRDVLEIETEIKEFNRIERGFANLNSTIEKAIDKSGIRNGHCTVRSKHTTAGIIEQEDEDGILYHDLPALLDRLVPADEHYEHDNLERRMPRIGPDERINGKAHLEHLLISRPVNLIVHDYKVDLGGWLSIIFVDFDPVGRKSRQVEISIEGE